MNIELYIANKLCDLEKSDLSIRLKRQLINPTELNTKDAQKSYNITLPSTPTNDQIFRYINVEETENKFSIYADAKLYVNGILILEGKFRLSEITSDTYRGNLGVPAPLTAKDIFGERKMNEIGEWELDDWERQPSMSKINIEKNPPVMFPLVIHGLPPKYPKDDTGKGIPPTGKDQYDKDTKFDMDDCPPSFNCIQMLKKIFRNLGYDLSGSATTDDRLKNLYVSYKNPNDKLMDWGEYKGVSFTGKWSLLVGGKDLETKRELNRDQALCAFNIFEGNNHTIDEQSIIDKQKWIIKNDRGIQIKIPEAGLYKISFGLTYTMDQEYYYDVENKFRAILGSLNKKWNPDSSEIFLTKNKPSTLDGYKFSNRYIRPAINQTAEINQIPTSTHLIYNTNNNVHFVDPAQTPNLLCGFSMGKYGQFDTGTQADLDNPIGQGSRCNPIAIKGGKSWDTNLPDFIYSAVSSPSYQYKGNKDANRFRVSLNAKASTTKESDTRASGEINQIVWLEKDDIIGMVDISSAHDYYQLGTDDVPTHSISYTIQIKPFRKDKDWIKIDDAGNGTGVMNWNDPDNYYKTKLDLTQFLPQESKINDWVDNFCKAFNLRLTHVEDKKFSLDVKETSLLRNTSLVIDLDKKANVAQRQNEPLNLPHAYELGFSINNSEHGYLLHSETEKDKDGKDIVIPNTGTTGGGTFYTNNNADNNTIKQNSNFSYCWYKPVTIATQVNKKIDIPVITDNEIWGKNDSDYSDMMKKKYLNMAQRFWYKTGETQNINVGYQDTTLALVSNTYEGNKSLELTYEDKPNSIMRNFFMLLTNEKNYTMVECYLTPEEYNDLDKSYIKFNGDLYTVAEADGYDPMGASKTKLKLIKKM